MKLRLTLAVLLALFAILTVLERFALVEVLLRSAGLPLLLALAEAVAILAAGALLRRTKRVDPAVDFLIGYPLFGAVCFLVGLLKVSMWTMVPLLVLFGLGGIALLLMRFAEDEPDGRHRVLASAVERSPGRAVDRGSLDLARDDATTHRATPIHRTAFLAVAAVLACGFVAALRPPSSIAEVTHHLAIPQTWILEGRAVELPLLRESQGPLGIESADLPLLTILGATGGGIASHFLHFFAVLATTVLIVRRTGSWLAAAAIVTTPALALAAGGALVLWPLAGLFVLLSMNDDQRTASGATAAGLLTSVVFLPFAILVWAFRRRLPSWTVLLGLVFYFRIRGLPEIGGIRELALADYIFEPKFLDEALGASLLILAPFATGAVPLATLAAAAALFFLAPSARLLVPFLVVPALSAAAAVQRRLVSAMVVIAVVLQTVLAVWFTARGTTPPADAAVTWLNESLPARSRTLLVGMNETYWIARPVRAGHLSPYLDVPTPEVLRERLRLDGITHVAVVAPANEERQALSPAAQRMLARALDRYAANVTSSGGTALFTLR